MYFAIFMLVILLVSGAIWLLDILVLRKKRQASALGDVPDPWYVEYSKSFFPVILLVFTVRSFIVEPFKIPSGSMMPTLLAGDYILVNKFTYGLRVPILNNVFYPVDKPKRGDVFVFHYPPDPSIDYIKRVVGLPGDKIQYRDKQLTINDKVINLDFIEPYKYALNVNDESGSSRAVDVTASRLAEQLGDVKHDVLIHDIMNQYSPGSLGDRLMQGEAITVPEGQYYAMGDNRDNSSDSRVWGFVSEKYLVGRAFFIWFNFDQWRRIGQSIG
jgi:signal peptidase I